MHQHYEHIRALLQRVRARCRALSVCRATVRGALAASAVLGIALATIRVAHWAERAPVALAILGALTLVAAIAALAWGLAPLRRVPSDGQIARFIEEHSPSLDDRLVTAVDLVQSERYDASPLLAEPLLADVARRADEIDVNTIVATDEMRRLGFKALAAAIVLIVLVFIARDPARQSLDAASLTLFPERIRLEVTPGNARVKAGSPLTIVAQLAGNRAPVVAQVQVADGENWRATDMTVDRAGQFRLAIESVTVPFKYRVVAGAVTSPSYDVAVAHAPRVDRIDVDYTYPEGLGLEPRTEEDSGDVYAPAGTDVRLRIHTDRPAATGHMAMGDGKSIALSTESPTLMTATLKVLADSSYRVALADPEGLSDPGDTEYFIRTLEDRPPEVHIVKPASDRSVTRLEEIDIEAQADDDYGIERFDLVYSVRGAKEKVVPLKVPHRATTATAHHTLFLEDLDVQPGDFVSYYARARDITRGKRSNEAKSDIFFLEVKPFEQEFSLAQSQSMAGSGFNGSLDDLVNAQKQVVVATWKLDRRGQTTKGAQSEQDIRTVSKTEADLKARVEETSSSFRESTMRDPRRRAGRGGQPPDAPRVGQTLPEEDAMAVAAEAMGKAVTSLNALKTGDALPPEMQALNALLKAQADVKKRQVTRQQAGAGGPGNNNRNYDISTLFDKELQRAQQTNYETPKTSQQGNDPKADQLDKIKDLARRQDELLKKQQELARQREGMTEEELKRQLEKLTREQSELRQQAEELARQMNQQGQSGQQSQQGQQSKAGQQGQGQQSQSSQQGQSGQSSQSGRSGQQGESSKSGESGRQLREISEEMRNATSELRRQDPAQASARGSKALEKLKELERQMQSAGPDEKRRALGEMQLETRQLADAERQVASELAKAGSGETGNDQVRRLAAEQERLAERTRRLHDGLKQQASSKGAAPDSRNADTNRNAQAAAGDVARELERQRLPDRMQQSAEQMRNTTKDPRGQAGAQEEMARELDKMADKLTSGTAPRDGETRKLTDQRSRAQELRDRINSLSRQIEGMNRQSGSTPGNSGPTSSNNQNNQGSQSSQSGSSRQTSPGQNGKPGQGQQASTGGSGYDLAKLREQAVRELQQTRELMDELRRENQNQARGGDGFTFEGQGMVLSSPGIEGFKQDFAKWEELRRQATQALDTIESSLSKKLQEKEAKDRLAAGVDDKAPPQYRKQIDEYFKALATKKKP